MASKRKRRTKAAPAAPRKRSGRAYRPDGFLAVGLAVNIVAGLIFSPITSITRVRVLGAEPFDRARIQGLMEGFAGRPVASLVPREIESHVTEAPEVKDVDFTRNWFGRAQLKITYRKPVAKVSGTPSLYLSDEGVLYNSRQKVGVLPNAELPQSSAPAALTFAVETPLEPLGELCARIPAPIDTAGAVALYHPEKGLCLNTGEASALVVFGPAERLDEKLAGLSQILRENPNILRENSEVNLIVPERATRTPLAPAGAPKQ